MKNKLIILFLIVSFCVNNVAYASSYIDKQIKSSKKNVKYSSVKKYTVQYDEQENTQSEDNEIKDPKLIKLSSVKQIKSSDYSKKIQQDEEIYKNKIFPKIKKKNNSININPEPIDFYNVYRIAEKIIRANNLDYVNWRIAIRKSPKDYNAETTAANLIMINTALYDSIYSNPDALAFIIGHELAHQILGHAQREADIEHRDKLWYYWLTYPTIGIGSLIYLSIAIGVNKKEYRSMEYAADALSLELITRAGFDFQNAMEAVNIMNALPHVDTLDSSHPVPRKRIENLKETNKYLNPHLEEEGKFNIYNSDVLSCKKSSDRVSIVITKSPQKNQAYYETESPEKILQRIAYTDYKNGDMKQAIKNFRKLSKISKSYVPYLYISYAYEYLFKQTKQDKYLTRAQKYAKKAKKIAPKDKYVKKQIKDLKIDPENL